MLQITKTILLGISLALVTLAQDPPMIKLERIDVIEEVLNAEPSPRTARYDGSLEGSYKLTKEDLVKGVAEVAKSQGLNLQAMLLSGPSDQRIPVYFLYSFVAERGAIRVNQSTFAMSRFTYKSTGTLTPAQFQGFITGLLSANVLDSGLPPPSNAAKYDLLLATWPEGKFNPYYGSFSSPKPQAKVEVFGKLIGTLLRSLQKTYPILGHPARPLPSPFPRHRRPPD